MELTRIYIGIGSNLNSPVNQVKNAFNLIAELPQSTLITCSSLYTSKPQGPQNQPNYINAVSLIETSLSPPLLLKALQSIESKQGRIFNKQRWGPRVLDLDILLYGNKVIESTQLTIPHPQLKHRDFVLIPLAEINKDLVLPDGNSITDLLSNCSLNLAVQLLSD